MSLNTPTSFNSSNTRTRWTRPFSGLAKRLISSSGQAMSEQLEPRVLLSTVFVDTEASGTNDGSSWENAFTSLQGAITAAANDDEIWVANGTYTPGNSRFDSFDLKAGVDLFGGFRGGALGGETSLTQRNPAANPTFLSGAIGGAGIGDNSFNVLTGTGNLAGVTVGGFTITGGNANGGGNDSQGGGVRLQNATGVQFLADMIFSNNNASNGGGIAFIGGTPTLRGLIIGNTATGDGGGLWVNAGIPTVEANFSNNAATNGGGAFWTNGAAGSLRASTTLSPLFNGNTATAQGGTFAFNGAAPSFPVTPTITGGTAGTNGGGIYASGVNLSGAFNINGATASANGGGIYLANGASLSLTGGSIQNNTANDGGGLYAGAGTTLTVGGATLGMNTATGDGGGIFTNQVNLSLNGTTLSDNTAINGGGLNALGGAIAITSTVIDSNIATNGGGAAFAGGATPSFNNVTISNNTASNNGGGLWATGGNFSLGTGSGITADSNFSMNRGGTLFTINATVTIAGSTFNNSTRATNGTDGGLVAVSGGTLNVSNSTFLDYRAEGDGAVLYADAAIVRVFNSKFYGGVAKGNGGAISIKGASTTTIAGSIFSGNFSGGFGGGIEIAGGTATLVNNTAVFNFVSNVVANAVFNGAPVNANDLATTTNGFGGFVGIRSGATVTIANSMIWNNTAVLPTASVREFQVFVQSGATVTVRNSLVLAGLPTRAIDGGGIQQTDPIFVTAGANVDGSGADSTPGTLDDNFDLAGGSPAIDAGDAADLPADVLDVNGNGNTAEPLPLDILGNNRVRAIGVDIGAYESSNAGVTPPEPGAPTTTALRGFAPNDEGNPSTDSFPIGQGFDLVAIGVQDGDGDLARVDYYFDTNDNGILEPGIDLLLGSVAYAEDGPGGQGFFDATIDDDGILDNLQNVGFDGIPDALQGERAQDLDNKPESFILRLNDAQVAAFGTGTVRFFARGVDQLNNIGPAEELEINLNDGSIDANFSLIIGGGAQRPIAAQVPFPTADRPEVIQLGDFDGDGLADAIVTTEAASNVVTIYYGQGDGTFTDRYDIPVGPRPEDIVLGDFNGDGRLDFATSNWPSDRAGNGSVTIVLNQGGRGAAAFPASAITTLAARNLRFGIDAGDLDGDGDIDLITANLANDSTSDIFLNTGNGAFTRINGPTVSADVGRIRLADLNNDGNLDVIYTTRSGGITAIYAQSDNPYVGSNGTLQPGSTATFAYPQGGGLNLRGLRFADLNDDGFIDMVVSNQASNTIAIYINDGSGGFAAGVLHTVGSAPEDIAIGDLNNDTIPDIAVANTGSANMSMLTNNGDGTFQPAITVTVGAGPEGVAIGDVTNDGANDIVTANIQANTISFLKNSIGRRSAVGTENAGGTNFVGIINQTANPVVFEQDATGQWFARRVNTGSIFLVGQMTALTVDGSQNFFATSSNGLRWFFPKNDGSGEYFDLDVASFAGAPGSADFAFSLSSFIDIQGNPHLFGLTTDGDYVTVRRTGVINGNWQWEFENISSSIRSSNPGITIPTIIEFEPYATRWDQWGLAGITDTGDVVSLWTTPTFDFWTISNLSDIVRSQTGGDVPLIGGLATVITRRFDLPANQQTQWDGINIGGLTGSGNLRVLWWAAANVNTDPNALDSGWRVADLSDPQATSPGTDANGLPSFAPERGLASYFTPWGGINYVGFNTAGQIQVYWWIPGFAGQYISSIITDTLPLGTMIPVADLNAFSAPNGVISVFGPGEDDQTLRLYVDPFAPGTSWGVENLTEIAQRII